MAAPRDGSLVREVNETEISQRAAAEAGRLLAGGRMTGAFLRDRAQIGMALPVTGPDGAIRFWFAPVVAGDMIAGYFRADADLSDWRWSSFQRRADTLAGCPSAALWLDEDAIRQKAQSVARPDETASAPRLSFDRVPDRIAWRVRLVSQGGGSRDVFVAGTVAWAASGGPVESYD